MTEEWACGYLLEFADGGPGEHVVLRRGPESDVEKTAATLERVGVVPYDGDRPVSHAIVFQCRVSALDAQAAVDDRVAELRRHPCYDRCVRIYRNALADWDGSLPIRTAAETLGLDRRRYCDDRLGANQFQWTAPGSGDAFTTAHVEAAWIEAQE